MPHSTVHSINLSSAEGRRLSAILGAVALCYAGTVVALNTAWMTNPLFSYGVAVPLIAGYLVWHSREELRALPVRPNYAAGLPILVVAAGLQLLGQVGAILILQGFSLILALVGLILLIRGTPTLRWIWFPILYLLLMLPAWDYPMTRLQQPSQELSARIATVILHAIGIPALLHGTMIAVPNRTLDVMRECSGVAQLTALIAMVVPAAYLWLNTFTRRVALLIVAVVVGYLSNGVRIALIGWLAAKQLSDVDPNSVMHTVQGLVVAMLGYGLIAACLSFLARHEPTRAKTTPADMPVPERSASPTWRATLELATVALFLLIASLQVFERGREVLPRQDLRAIPSQIGAWTVVPADADPQSFLGIDDRLVGSEAGGTRFEAADDELWRVYQDPSGARIRIYVGYYRHQEQGKELAGRISHALQAVASGVDLAVDHQRLGINEIVGRGPAPKGVVFWYDVNGRVVANIYVAKAYTMWDALVHGRTNAAVVVVSWDGGGASDDPRRGALDFAAALMPVVRQYLPS